MRKPKKYSEGMDREFHSVRELHPTLPEVDTTGEDGPSVLRQLNQITADRCADAISKILQDPVHFGHTLLLVGHGASTRWVVSHLTGPPEGTGRPESGPVGSVMELERVASALERRL